MPKDVIDGPKDSATERFHDSDRSFKIEKLSGLIIESWYDKPSIGILPDGTRLTQQDGEDAVDFLERCEAQISTESIFANAGGMR